jgi:hypothetical protein
LPSGQTILEEKNLRKIFNNMDEFKENELGISAFE